MLQKFIILIGSILFLTATVVAGEPEKSYQTATVLHKQDTTGPSTQFVYSEDQRIIVIAASGCKSTCIKTKNACAANCNSGVRVNKCKGSCKSVYRSCMRSCN